MSIHYLARLVLRCVFVAILAGCAGQSQLALSGPLQAPPLGRTGRDAAVKDSQGIKAESESTPYSLVDLGTFGGPESVVPQGQLVGPSQILNDRGTVVGWADTAMPDPFPAFCFDQLLAKFDLFSPDCNLANAFESQNGILAQLGGLSQDSSAPVAISDSGLITGMSQNGQTDPLVPGFPELRAVFWDGQQATDLGTLGGNESYASGVNDRKQIAGSALNAVADPYSFFGVFTAFSSNSTQTRAFEWQNNSMTDIGTLGGPDAEGVFINARGQIAGDSYTNDVPNADSGIPTDDPFLWTPSSSGDGGTMQDLGTLGGDSIVTDEGLNDKGEVIGSLFLAGDQSAHPISGTGNGSLISARLEDPTATPSRSTMQARLSAGAKRPSSVRAEE
jgi:probable HAF family extracellular repeat protein